MNVLENGSVGIGPFTVDDIDIDQLEGPDLMKVTLGVDYGTISLASTTGLVGDLDGSDGTLEITGTRANLDLALTSVTYSPDLNHNAPDDSLSITVDDLGTTAPPDAATSTAAVGITIDPVNSPPTVLNGQNFPILEDTPTLLNINLQSLAADIETPDSGLTFTLVSATVLGSPLNSSQGVLTTPTNGMWTFDTALDFNGQVKVVANVTDDGDDTAGPETTPLTLTITVNPVNDPPVANNPFATGTTLEDDSPYVGIIGGAGPTDIPIAVLATDVDNTLTKDSFTFDSVTINGVPVPTLADAGITYTSLTGEFSLDPSVAAYQPLAAGEIVPVVVSFTVTDGLLGDTGEGTFYVEGINDDPVANDDPEAPTEYALECR